MLTIEENKFVCVDTSKNESIKTSQKKSEENNQKIIDETFKINSNVNIPTNVVSQSELMTYKNGDIYLFRNNLRYCVSGNKNAEELLKTTQLTTSYIEIKLPITVVDYSKIQILDINSNSLLIYDGTT